MKILQFMASKRYVGAERSFVELSNELAKSEEVVALVVRECEFKDRFSDRVKVIELTSNPSRYNPLLYIEIAKILKELKPDIIHTHSAKATEIIYRLSKWMKLPPFVATKRNSEQKSKKVRYFDLAPFAVGVSQEVTQTINNPNKMTIYNGIEVKEADIAKEPVFTMVAVGILQPRKGFDDLIKQVAQLSFDFRLWIVGEGEQRGKLEELIEKLQLGQKVKLLGQREDVANLLAKAHLQIINSKREGLSRVLIEGLFYSDVVISTKVAGSTELLPKRFLFDFGKAKEKIEDVYANYEAYKKDFSKIERNHFRLERVAREYKALYQRVAGV